MSIKKDNNVNPVGTGVKKYSVNPAQTEKYTVNNPIKKYEERDYTRRSNKF